MNQHQMTGTSGIAVQKKGSVKVKQFIDHYQLYIFIVPAIVVTILFSYLPMFSNIIAFMDYDIGKGWMGLSSPFVGLKWFEKIFTDPYFLSLIWRTFFYSVILLVVGFPSPLILALLINEVRSKTYKKVIQTVSYLPRFVSWVTMASLIYIFLSTDSAGIINNLKQLVFGGERIIFFKDPANFPFILAISHLFKTTGWGSIIYLAAISSLDVQLYEAAKIDGAGRFKQFIHITFPGILPTTVIMIIFALGGLFSTGFDQIFNLQNRVIQTDTNTINTYSYYMGVRAGEYSTATAIGLFQGVVNCITLLMANYFSKKITKYGLF